MSAALRAEWTKLATLRSTRWTLLVVMALTVAFGLFLASGSSSTPPGAGFAVQQTVVRDDAIPIAPWAGLGVTAAWAAGALLVALVVVRRRDA